MDPPQRRKLEQDPPSRRMALGRRRPSLPRRGIPRHLPSDRPRPSRDGPRSDDLFLYPV